MLMFSLQQYLVHKFNRYYEHQVSNLFTNGYLLLIKNREAPCVDDVTGKILRYVGNVASNHSYDWMKLYLGMLRICHHYTKLVIVPRFKDKGS